MEELVFVPFLALLDQVILQCNWVILVFVFCLEVPGLRSRVLSQNHFKVMIQGQWVPKKLEGGMYICFIVIFISYRSFYTLDLKTLFLSPRSCQICKNKEIFRSLQKCRQQPWFLHHSPSDGQPAKRTESNASKELISGQKDSKQC